jgi:hypothetical protein
MNACRICHSAILIPRLRASRRSFSTSEHRGGIPLRAARGVVNGQDTLALLASESATNIVSAEFVKEQGLSHEITGDSKSLDLGDGTQVHTYGSVSLTWQADNVELPLSFDVLPRCNHGIILGRSSFGTEAFSNLYDFSDTSRIGVPIINLLGTQKNAVIGLVDGHPTLAIPATGCEINIISFEFLQRNGISGLITYSRWGSPRRIRLADESTCEAIGHVTLPWNFDDGDGSEQQSCDLNFEVVTGWEHDVVLGNQALFVTGFYDRYEMSEVEAGNGFSGHSCLKSHYGRAPAYIAMFALRRQGENPPPPRF